MATTSVAAAQGLALLGYGLGISIIGLTSGLEGPAEVSSPIGAIVEVATFGLFGVAMISIAFGRWHQSSWSGPPFVLSQLLALAVGLPLATATDAVGRTIGFAVTASVLVGLGAMIVGLWQSPPEQPDSDDPRRSTDDNSPLTKP